MRNETELTSDIQTGELAKAFINNPLFIQGIAVLKAETLDKFESLNFRQTKKCKSAIEC